jgi:hypothetical protein
MKPSSRPGETVNLSQTVQHRLNMYALAASAAGVAVLALARPSEAKIIYRPAHQKIPLNQFVFLDLNHDGMNDFRLYIQTSGSSCGARNDTCTPFDVASMAVSPQLKGNGAVGNLPYASALRAGVSIGPKVHFNTSRGSMGAVEYVFGRQLKYWGQWADSGKPVDNRYLGLQFKIKGKIHYGWARFNVRIYRNPNSTVNAVLTGYAYETIPNKPIIAGRTKGSDGVAVQPASLGHLALGASAIPAWRVKPTAATTH